MFYDILDKKRKDVLPLLADFKKGFYLGGGTALALQLGHRDSVDFDFFNQKDLDTKKLFDNIRETFSGKELKKIQEEKNTLTVLVDKDIKLSFFTYKYPLIKDLKEEKYLNLASVEDIGCMKLSAIISRATNKDYIDLYYILQRIELPELLKWAEQKFPEIETNLILKSLVYFEDVEVETINFKHNKEIDFEEVKNFLIKKVKEIQEG